MLKTCVEHVLLCLLHSFQNVSSAIKSGKLESTPLRLKTSKTLWMLSRSQENKLEREEEEEVEELRVLS